MLANSLGWENKNASIEQNAIHAPHTWDRELISVCFHFVLLFVQVSSIHLMPRQLIEWFWMQ